MPVDVDAAAAARARHDRLTKPPGSLGRLEDVGVQLCAIARQCPPPVPEPATVAVFAADHGVLAEGISPWPQEVTAQMVANFGAGGAAVNVLARHVGAQVVVIDVGVATELPEVPGLRRAKVRAGTANLAKGPAMTRVEAEAALEVGAVLAAELVDAGARCLLTGDMGIGNTTPSAALIAVLCGRTPAEVTGRGTGIDDERMARKVEIVASAVARAAEERASRPLDLLASIGGLEIAALAGYIVGGAAARVPVLLDGVIAAAGAVVAAAMVPDSVGYLVAGHRSTEPGATAALEHLGLVPLLDLDLRLGEGTGACLALPVLQAAARVLREMATFDSAGVNEGPA
ncbi:MAG TPA: nicotinate-nucleotide--dimethylbenzimidazole phosphoribosyltransferase [Acidimicrobiales bacterium]|nr:nicotinate-nucleotide--dimethylbenzimidazole phosphoribosyltransferase [Acidimicrobiales bacterium]